SIFETVARLQRHFSDYEKAANASAETDQGSLATSMHKTGVGAETDLLRNQTVTEPAKRTSAKAADIKNAAKWGLWGKKRLMQAVERFRSENRELEQILSLATAAHVQQLARPELALDKLMKDEDANRLGLAAHAEIRQVVTTPESKNEDLRLDANLTSHSDFSVSDTASKYILQCCTLTSKGGARKQTVLVEYKSYPPGSDSSEVLVDNSRHPRVQLRVNQLANLLRTSGKNSVGSLECLGFVDQPDAGRYAFVYDFPKESDSTPPKSLYSAINEDPVWSLSARFNIASLLAMEIGGFHADGWVHKSLRSHSVVFFKSRDTEANLLINTPYLVGFEYSRPEEGPTTGVRDDDKDRNLYQHPNLQAITGDSFTKVHDLYSLGVVLLEVAVWCTASRIYDKIYERAPARSTISLTDPTRIDPRLMHQQYVKVAKAKIPYLMGEAYLKAVLACLESEYSNIIFRPESSKIFYDEVIQKLSPGCLME
ncbi:MAG: hypothetical protein LQ337_008295, partial [Flavoplaca oasis]